MKRTKSNSRGFTLIASLLLLLLMSAMAVGLFMMVNTEGKAGGHDLQNTVAFRSAEGGIEKMTADLANEFQSIQNPSVSQIEALSSNNPNTSTYVQYTLTPATVNNDGVTPLTHWTQIPSGVFAGLNAQTLDVTLNSTAQSPLNDQVSMMRTVQIAMVPVFQFGAFSETDLSYTNNPTFTFSGRVHTNGDLYLSAAGGNTVTFLDKVEAYGNVIREIWPNGLNSAASGGTGDVQLPTASGGCNGPGPTYTACKIMNPGWGSLVGFPSPSQNSSPTWVSTSETTYTGMFIDGDNGNSTYGTGAKNLNLPFISGTDITNGNTAALQHQMIQRPPAGESATGALGSSRLYNQAQIRILLSDNPNEFLSNPTNSDGQSIRLANTTNTGSSNNYTYGVPTLQTNMPALASGHAYTTYFATGSTAVPNSANWTGTGYALGGAASQSTLQTDWSYAPLNPSALQTLTPSTAPIMSTVSGIGLTTGPTATNLLLCTGTTTPSCPTTYPYTSPLTIASTTYSRMPIPQPGDALPAPPQTAWNLLDGYLRVEAYESGNWVGVTQEWLKLGFARGSTSPTTALSNPVNPKAILILQQIANRNAGGGADAIGAAPYCTSSTSHGVTTYTCYPGKPPEVMYDQITSSATPLNNTYFGDSYYATTSTPVQSNTMFNWYPINFYDSREGETWDVRNTTAPTCAVNGIMNAVELDVGNLNAWLTGTSGTTGTLVSSLSANGYIVYFSDRRGMLPSPTTTSSCTVGTKCGEYGFEDTINLSNSGAPNGSFEPTPSGKLFSPEDVDQDTVLETYGATNLGLGFGYSGAAYSSANSVNKAINSNPLNPYVRVACDNTPSTTLARKNWVSGARHVLKLVDGGEIGTLTQLPLPGFTVGSENPVYVIGDYNSNIGDTEWSLGTDSGTHSNAAVIADAVTLLSNNWMDWGEDASNNDIGSFSKPQTSVFYPTVTAPTAGKTAVDTAYRLAIAAGKPVNFQNVNAVPAASNSGGGNPSWGTDGGVGNFLRFLEDWCSNTSKCTTRQTVHYAGSVVSLFYNEYATGTFKCCDIVYNPPTRDYHFDQDFTVPSGLPPGTPMFRDIDNLNYRQLLTQRGNSD
jgi:Tfp pilus assembly protein PilX